jgi:ribonuclease HI
MLSVDMYTDGSCLRNPGGPGGYGVIVQYIKKGRIYEKRASEGYEDTTNNRMELTAVIRGFTLIPEKANITVYTDSKYIVDAFHKNWVENWQRVNWDRGERGGEVKNVDLWKSLLCAMKNHTVEFIWVKGHNGLYYNELCDKMAVLAAHQHKGTYKEGYVKEESPLGEGKPNKLKFNVKQVTDTEMDLLTVMKSECTFIIIPTGSYDSASENAGEYKVLLKYGLHEKICSGMISSCKSANEVMLSGIMEAVEKIRLHERTIIVITGTSLGFSNPNKSANKELIRTVAEAVDNIKGKLEILEVNGGMKRLKKIISESERGK